MQQASWIRLLVAFGLLVISVASPAETLLTPHRAEYKVSVSVFTGQLNTELRTTPGGYVATHAIKTTGMSRMLASGNITETSMFAPQPEGIRPRTFQSNDTLTRDKNRAEIQFDWASGEATGTVNGEAFASSMDAVAYDRVSIQYELMSDLMNGTTGAEYVLFDIDELKTITVQNIGTRIVSVPAGKYEAIGVRHQAPGSKRVTTMWCVRELNYLPVIVEQHRNGKLRMRAELRSYSPLPT
ncbi:MAG: DUF3108 domain-containing protein [Gammaproteobacteria bacterium]|nr:DUF3108 domain-containing protein [Gammaproteobacteria bacterium]MDH5305140.1 DUF3108 domain-containing protein [Gammaproteobacteria bacterium]